MAAKLVRITNVSGSDRDVPLAGGRLVVVPAGATASFDADVAARLVEQTRNWQLAAHSHDDDTSGDVATRRTRAKGGNE